MAIENIATQTFRVGTLKLEIHLNTEAAGAAAANAIAKRLRELSTIQKDIAGIFATRNSQL
jgi:hypothetical protein